MSKATFYRQCFMKKSCGASTLSTTSYIPDEFATVGATLKLRQDDGEWENGWVVVTVGRKIAAQIVEDADRLWTRTRKYSDI